MLPKREEDRDPGDTIPASAGRRRGTAAIILGTALTLSKGAPGSWNPVPNRGTRGKPERNIPMKPAEFRKVEIEISEQFIRVNRLPTG